MEALTMREPVGDEVLVEMAGCGICHTDIKVSQGYGGIPLPVVLGHEGSGTVMQIGAEVTDVMPGDHVVISFPFCGLCSQCFGSHPAYCERGQELAFSCNPASGLPTYLPGMDKIHGAFFGQSSFASHALVPSRNLVKVDKELPLELLGPLGCGFQTGAGSILNVLQPVAGTSLAVFGVGNVGLSAVMAARIAGMFPVIAVDKNPARLQMAEELGASHVINPAKIDDLAASIQGLTGNSGVNYSIDTTNIPAVIRAAFCCLANRGICVHSGGGGQELTFPGTHLLHGRTVTGVIQGDSVPQVFIPLLLRYYQEGKFPFDKLLQVYPLNEINRAVSDMRQGQVIKPVLRCIVS